MNFNHFHVSLGLYPSQAVVRTVDQFVSVRCRAGNVTEGVLNLVKEVIKDVRLHSQQLNRNEYLMLRGIWVDDKHGNIILFIDLIHDQDITPSFDEEKIKELFHDGWAGDFYSGQAVSVSAKVIKESVESDGFFCISDTYYKRVYDSF